MLKPATPLNGDGKPSKRRRYRWLLLSLLGLAVLLLISLSYSDTATNSVSNLGTRLQDSVNRQWQSLANQLKGPVRVGIQIGHEDAAKHPEELANLRFSTGGRAGGVNEVVINRKIARALKTLLEAQGILVDLIPATPPVAYKADLFIALHSDSSPNPKRRGYKSAYFEPARNRFEPLLKSYLDKAYMTLSRLPNDDRNVSSNMLAYYAFNNKFRYSVRRSTPAVIVEMGYISNARDLAFLQGVQAPARALSEGVIAYLLERGRLPSDGARLLSFQNLGNEAAGK